MSTTQVVAAPRQPLLPPANGRAGFADALRSEFTKIRSTRSTYWTLLALVVVTVGIGAIVCYGAASHASMVDRASFDATQLSLGGLYVGHLVIAVLGALTITSEYSTGMIRTSLAVQPRRGTIFAARLWCSRWSRWSPGWSRPSCRSSSARQSCRATTSTSR
jgi:ABC-2 type transport system permease protein